MYCINLLISLYHDEEFLDALLSWFFCVRCVCF